MPLHLEPLGSPVGLENVDSVLIVLCPVCPPVSLAMQKGSPLIELFKRGLKTGAFEDYIEELREQLEERRTRTGVLTIYTPCPTMCLWTEGQRRRLLKRARDYEAVIVLGCDSATRTVREALEGTACRVVQGMRMTGLINATVKFRFPTTVLLERVNRVSEGDELERTM